MSQREVHPRCGLLVLLLLGLCCTHGAIVKGVCWLARWVAAVQNKLSNADLEERDREKKVLMPRAEEKFVKFCFANRGEEEIG